ncbi:MAG: hypothetical protein ACRD5R_13290 [Candidatus Acidiferrales bacterium]
MQETDEIKTLIGWLAEADPARREHAAAEIYRRGTQAALSAARDWMKDAELARLFSVDSGGVQRMTVGIAVTPANFESLHASNGSPRLANVPPDQDAREFELHFPHGARLDILTTREPRGNGAIARFLEKFSEGIQQVEFLVRDVDQAMKILKARFAVAPIYVATRAGADDTRVNFFLAGLPEGGKILIELVEEKP